MNRSTLGFYIRALRTQNGMTQARLAERLGVTDKAVSKWERDISYPDIALFPKLADVLGVNVNDLLKECVDAGQPSRLAQIFEMSHDIRTPLHIILGCADMAENHFDDKAQVLRYLKSIRISGEYLLAAMDRVMHTANQEYSGYKPPVSAAELEDLLRQQYEPRRVGAGIYDLTGRRILIVEDMEINREISGELLKRSGAEVEFAEDGQVCLDMITSAEAGHYDLILMDVMMPNMDGVEATRRIRRLADSKKASVPIVALTADVYERGRNIALEAGMDDFAEKPIRADKLFETINRCLGGDIKDRAGK